MDTIKPTRHQKTKMLVKLEAKPNPDFDSTSLRGSIYVPAKWIEVYSLKEASEVCKKFIKDHELGGGNWTGGEIVGCTEFPTAYVSYNGSVWDKVGYVKCSRIEIE